MDFSARHQFFIEALLASAYKSQADKPVDKLLFRDAFRFPEHRVHTDGGKTGHRIDLIKDDLPFIGYKEVHTGKPIAVYSIKDFLGSFFDLLGRAVRQLGIYDGTGFGVKIFGFKIIKICSGEDLAYAG